MGLLDAVVGALAQGQGPGLGQLGSSGAPPDLLRIVLGMLGNDAPTGGLSGLVEKFQQAGLGEVVGSWISTGQNVPISGDQLGQVIGPDMLGQLARQLGLAHGEASGQLAQWLPQIVDQLTPHGQAPAGGLGNVGDLLGMLMKR